MGLFGRRIQDLKGSNVQSSSTSSVVVHDDRKREYSKFFNSLQHKTKLYIPNLRIDRWTVRGELLYFSDIYDNKILVYSIEQSRIVREFPYERESFAYRCDFTFVGDNFFVTAGADFVRLWNLSDGTLLASKAFEFKYGYTSCVPLDPVSFLYIAGDTIRRFDITTIQYETVQLEQANTVKFDKDWIWPSEVCGRRIVFVFKESKKLGLFDVTEFKIIAHLDLYPHLIEGYQLGFRTFDVTFPDRIVFCVGDSAHSKLKFLILEPNNLSIQKSFILANPIHSTLANYSNLSDDGFIWIDANESSIRMQYNNNIGYFYQLLEISMGEEKITSSYNFHVEKYLFPSCKSVRYGVIAVDGNGDLIFGETRNERYGPIEQLYQGCIQTGKRASRVCEQLSPNLFNESLFEFYCAHRLLMMAIQDGDIQRSLHHNGVEFKWHKAIYSASRNIKIENPEDDRELTLILMEAAKNNVIESVGQFLLANEILSDVRENNENIYNMGRNLFLRVAQLETAHLSLDLAFQRYRRVQGMTELMGIAFNIIPFLGGSIAAAVSAGAGLLEGLQLSDVITGSLEISMDIISQSSTFEQGVLKFVGKSLRAEEIENKIILLKSLHKCDVTIAQLQEILDNGINEDEDTSGQQNYGSQVVEDPVQNFVGSSMCESGMLPDERTTTVCLSNMRRDLSTLEQWKISEFREFRVEKEAIRSLTIRQCSFFVSALMLLFDDELEEAFKELQPLLLVITRSRMISGSVLCDYSKYSKQIDGIINDLEKVYPVNDVMTEEFKAFVTK